MGAPVLETWAYTILSSVFGSVLQTCFPARAGDRARPAPHSLPWHITGATRGRCTCILFALPCHFPLPSACRPQGTRLYHSAERHLSHGAMHPGAVLRIDPCYSPEHAGCQNSGTAFSLFISAYMRHYLFPRTAILRPAISGALSRGKKSAQTAGKDP